MPNNPKSTGSDLTWGERPSLERTGRRPEPMDCDAEISVFDVLSGEATWEDLDRQRIAS